MRLGEIDQRLGHRNRVLIAEHQPARTTQQAVAFGVARLLHGDLRERVLGNLQLAADAAQRATQRPRLGGGQPQIGGDDRHAGAAEPFAQLRDGDGFFFAIHDTLLTPPACVRPAD